MSAEEDGALAGPSGTLVSVRPCVSVVVGAAAFVVGSVPAWSQVSGPERAFQGVFSTADRPAREKLDLSLSLGEAYDSDTPPEIGIIDPAAVIAGASTMFVGTADYRRDGTRAQFGASGTSAFRYFNGPHQFRTVSHTAGAGASVRLDGRTTLLLNQSIAYSPSYLYGLFPREIAGNPGEAITAAPDYTVSDSESYLYATMATVTRGLTSRSRVSASGIFAYTDFRQENENRHDVSMSGADAEFSRHLTRNVGLAVGYRYRTGDFGDGTGVSTEHGADAGVEYTRPVSSTRAVTLGVRIGTTTIVPQGPALAMEPSRRHWLASGDIKLEYPLGRTWTTTAAYRRGTAYVPELTEVVSSDGVLASVGGMLASRADFVATAGYSAGGAAVSRAGSQFDTYTGTARVRYGLTRTTAAYVEYFYYFYNFGQGTPLTVGLPPRLERNGVRAGLTFWLPAVRR